MLAAMTADAPAPRPAIEALCLFCGSRTGHDPAHALLAGLVGVLLAEAGVTLVYGGGSLGLMGVAARACLAAGGRVVGVIPDYLATREIAQTGLSELVLVDSLMTRKKVMAERADAFLALPGGVGTLDETLEMMTWAELGQHGKPTWLLGANGYWQPFQALLDHVAAAGFGDARALGRLIELPDIATLAALLGVDPARIPSPGHPALGADSATKARVPAVEE